VRAPVFVDELVLTERPADVPTADDRHRLFSTPPVGSFLAAGLRPHLGAQLHLGEGSGLMVGRAPFELT